jgi:hypothetical protein
LNANLPLSSLNDYLAGRGFGYHEAIERDPAQAAVVRPGRRRRAQPLFCQRDD